MKFDDAAQPAPMRGYVWGLDLGPDIAAKLAGLAERIAGGVPLDEVNEQAELLRDPLPVAEDWNGLVAAEIFGRAQIPHIHFDDEKNASERYILLCPSRDDAEVRIAPLDAPDKAERILFKKGQVYLLHFNGGDLHRFAILGTDPQAKLYAFAFHTRDVATSRQALTEQTRAYPGELPDISPARTFTAPTIPAPLPAAVDYCLQVADFAFREGNKWGETERALADIALRTAKEGQPYGAPAWASVRRLEEWLKKAQDRDWWPQRETARKAGPT